MLAWLVACAGAGEVRAATADLARAGQDPLPIRATWTDGTAPMPVIVFSHGLAGSRDGYQPLVRAWAERGYLVLQPTHPDSLAYQPRSEWLSDLRDARGYAARSLGDWDERPREVSFVLDHLDDLGRIGVDLARVDREHVGVGGHSFGAHTAALCGGLVTLAREDLAEPRADAILLLSPQGPGGGVPDDGYGAIHLPTLMVTGSEDVSPVTGQGPDWRLGAWTSLGSDQAWLLYLDGATHNLGGVSGRWFPGAGATDPALLQAVIDATTAFWDATLRGDAAARARLDHPAPTDPRVHLTAKAPATMGR
jgi:dienelactone hydrolase